MTLEELYNNIDGDYKTMKSCFGDDSKIEKYLLMFLNDDSCRLFEEAVGCGDVKTAFRAIHTLKGVCLNLGLSSFFKTVDIVTEGLRREDIEFAKEYLPMVKALNEEHISAIEEYKRCKEND